MNVYKGKIITCDAENTVAEYLVENKGRIEYIGASAGPFCHPIDLPFYPEIAGQAVQHVSPSSAPKSIPAACHKNGCCPCGRELRL